MNGSGTGGFGVSANAAFQQVPPFPITAADNGLSVDPVTGRIVLGNDIGGVTAALLSSREIPMGGNTVQFTDPGLTGFLTSSALNFLDSVNGNNQVIIQSGAGGSNLSVECDSSVTNPANVTLTDLLVNLSSRIEQFAGEHRVVEVSGERWLSLDQVFGQCLIGDIDGAISGWYLSIDGATGFHELKNDTTNERVQLWDTGAGQIITGDVANITTGLQELVDINAGEHSVRNTALNAFYSCNGVAGFTGTVTPVTSITVEGGIVTAVT